MDEGLIQLLVIGFFVIVSLMDGAARKRRKQAQSMGRIPGPGRPSEAADDLEEGPQTSEGMVPRDLWEEIAELTRGEVPDGGIDSERGPATRSGSRPRPDTLFDPSPEVEDWNAPRETPQSWRPDTDDDVDGPWSLDRSDHLDAQLPSETGPTDLQSGYLHPDQATSHERHAHERHVDDAALSWEPRELSPRASASTRSQDADPARSRARASQGLLKGIGRGDRSSLREAIVLAEVLNLPVALRDSDRRPPGDG